MVDPGTGGGRGGGGGAGTLTPHLTLIWSLHVALSSQARLPFCTRPQGIHGPKPAPVHSPPGAPRIHALPTAGLTKNHRERPEGNLVGVGAAAAKTLELKQVRFVSV